MIINPRKYTGTLLLLAMATLLHAQQIRYVKAGATGNGSSWSDASGDLQAAITASASGDTIWVASGVYQPAAGSNFIMKSGVKILGGFTGTETGISQRNLANKATLKGNGSGVIKNVGNGLSASAVLDGFIITGGLATFGGGIENNFASSPTIANCIFSGNSAYSDGGGIYNSSSAAPRVTNCVFSGNTAGSRGGGMYNGSSSPTLTNCSFSGNRAPGGGGIYNASSFPVVTSCIIYGNSSGIANDGATPTISYSDVQDGVPAGTGNSSTDPLFINAPAYTGAPFTGGDYALQNGSPAIDAGDDNALPAGTTTDLAGDPRIKNSKVDMGAYEYQGATLPVLWGTISAILKNGELQVHWSTATETFNDHFLVQVSGDGISWETVQTIPSKAPEGNSSTPLAYGCSVPLAAMGLSAAMLLLGAVATPGRKQKYILLIILALGASMWCCNKKGRLVAAGNGKLLVRIVQVDKDNAQKASKVVRAVQE